MVNIAVFAAFAFCDQRVLLSNAGFKPSCAIWQLDVWCYGRQKRQHRGKEMAMDGKAGGKNGNVVSGSGHVHVATFAAAGGVSRADLPGYAVVQTPAAPGGAAMIELNYHGKRQLSRCGGGDRRAGLRAERNGARRG